MRLPPPPSHKVPANKFYPPRLARGKILKRNRIIADNFREPRQFQYIFLEAQAGQGKTTTATQLLEHEDQPYIWYQVGPEDCDPLLFLSALLSAFSKAIPTYSSPRMKTMMESGEATMLDLSRLVNFMLHDLDRFLSKGYTIVFDDLHLIGNSPHTLELVDLMLETAPDQISFMLISREPLPFKSKKARFGSSTLYLSNSDLAFSRQETIELLETLLEKVPGSEIVSNLFSESGGWPMGLVLACHHLASGGCLPKRFHGGRNDSFAEYFEGELFSAFPENLQNSLIKLSLLDDIPISLAGKITELPQIEDELELLMERNCFVRLLDDHATVFGLHQLFRGFLRKKAESFLSAEKKLAVLRKAADFYLDHGMPDKAMGYLLRAGDYAQLETLLEKRGMELTARNRLVTLGSIVSSIPATTLHISSWFSFYLGIVTQTEKPDIALQAFERARQLFREAGNSKAELLTLGQLIYLYIIHSNRIKGDIPHPHQAADLFQQVGDELPIYCRIVTAKNIALGFLYLLTDLQLAQQYSQLAVKLTSQSGLPNLIIESRVVRGWSYVVAGHYVKGMTVAEQNFQLIKDRELGLYSRLQLYFLQLDTLRHFGDVENYFRQKNECLEEVGEALVSRTFVYPFLILWDIELFVSKGLVSQAESLVDKHFDSEHFTVGNFRAEMRAWKAFFLALHGRFATEGQFFADEVHTWRTQRASPYHRTKITTILAAAYGLGGDASEARQLLDEVISETQKHQLYLTEARAYFHLAWLAIQSSHSEARSYLEKSVALFKAKRVESHIPAFTPPMFQETLQVARRLGIMPTFVCRLAQDRLQLHLTEAGETVPLLAIRSLGGFELSFGDRPVGQATDFTPTQREFLGIVISHPDMRVSQEQIQTNLWPDSPPKKARSRFDTLMTRLRKNLEALLAPHPVKNYLNLNKGIVSIENCTVDAREFTRVAKEALKQGQKGEWWQAGNKLHPAFALWRGAFVADIFGGDSAHRYGLELTDTLTKVIIEWSFGLARLNRLDEAARLAEKAYKIDPSNDRLARLLYHLHLQNNDTMQAGRLLKRYAEALKREGFTEKEIHDLVHEVSSPEN